MFNTIAQAAQRLCGATSENLFTFDGELATRPGEEIGELGDNTAALRAAIRSDDLLRLEGLKVQFPIRGSLVDTLRRRPGGVIRAVDGIDLTLRKGEVLGLVGESGSGKTTTGRVIVKLTRQTGGRVIFEGREADDQ